MGATIVSKQVWEKIPGGAARAHVAGGAQVGQALSSDIRAQGDKAIAAMTQGLPGKKALKLTVVSRTPPRWPIGASRPKPSIPR